MRSSKCLENSQPDEPVFILCARDKTAPAVVMEWAARAGVAGAPAEKVVGARRIAEEMILWQQAHPDQVKVPD